MARTIEITTRRDGFRRAGIAHVGTACYPAAQFSAEQLEGLMADPMLLVREVDDAPSAEMPAAGKAGKA